MVSLMAIKLFLHSCVDKVCSAIVQAIGSAQRVNLLATMRLHAWLENVFNTAEFVANGTGLQYLLHRQLIHSISTYRHENTNFEMKRLSSKIRMSRFIRVVGEFYQEDTINPLALVNIGFRMYRMLVGVLLYMRATWMLKKATKNTMYCETLLQRYPEIFPNGEI